MQAWLPGAGGQGKVAKMATMGSKMATRLPSTGLKMPKMATLMENGDTCDRCDTLDTLGAVPLAAAWPGTEDMRA